MERVYFYERQHGQPWIHGLALLLGIAALVMLLPGPNEDLTPLRGSMGLGFLLTAVILLNQFTMTTWVYQDRIRVQLGRLIPFHTTFIPIADLKRIEVIEYSGMAESGGWGRSDGTHDGEPVRYLHARSGVGVLMETPKGCYVIGTQFGDRLAEAVKDAASGREEAEKDTSEE